MKVKKLLKIIEEEMKVCSMLNYFQLGIALKVIEDITNGKDSLYANKLQHKIIEKEGGHSEKN